jgi:hypothetical protein
MSGEAENLDAASHPRSGRVTRVLAITTVVVFTWFIEKGFKSILELF